MGQSHVGMCWVSGVCVCNIDLCVKGQTGEKRNLVGKKENVLLHCPGIRWHIRSQFISKRVNFVTKVF